MSANVIQKSLEPFRHVFIYYFTLLELLIVIAVIAILASLLLPALRTAREQAKKIQCSNNLRTFNTAILFYCGDFNDFVPAVRQDTPSGSHWYQTNYTGNLINYLDKRAYTGKSGTVCQCPVNPTAWHDRNSAISLLVCINYGGNKYWGGEGTVYIWPRKRLSSFKSPSKTLGFADSTIFYMSEGTPEDFDFRHANKTNCLFVDGHINGLGISEIPLPYMDIFWDAGTFYLK